jgi:hypothetical protein
VEKKKYQGWKRELCINGDWRPRSTVHSIILRLCSVFSYPDPSASLQLRLRSSNLLAPSARRRSAAPASNRQYSRPACYCLPAPTSDHRHSRLMSPVLPPHVARTPAQPAAAFCLLPPQSEIPCYHLRPASISAARVGVQRGRRLPWAQERRRGSPGRLRTRGPPAWRRTRG